MIGKVIDSYLESDDNQALQINGSWGSGKTFYIKKKIEEIEKNNATSDNNTGNKHYPIYISLYGMKDIRDVRSKISRAILRNIGNLEKGIYSTLDATNNIFDLLDDASSESELPQKIKAIKSIGKGISLAVQKNKTKKDSFKKYVIIFDDLERISAPLKIEQVLGYIANLLEEKECKVIIISDESKIKNKLNAKEENDQVVEDKSYSEIKEKVINKTFEFGADAKETALSIIEEDIKDPDPNNVLNTLGPKYSAWIMNASRMIMDTQKEINLRTIKSIISSYKQVLVKINEAKENLPNKILETAIKNAYLGIFVFTQEYKKGWYTNISDKNNLLGVNYSLFLMAHSKNGEEKEAMERIHRERTDYGQAISDFNGQDIYSKQLYDLVVSDIFDCQSFLETIEKFVTDSQNPIFNLTKKINLLHDIQNDENLISMQKRLWKLISHKKNNASSEDIENQIFAYTCLCDVKVSECRYFDFASKHKDKKYLFIKNIKAEIKNISSKKLEALTEDIRERSNPEHIQDILTIFTEKIEELNETKNKEILSSIIKNEWREAYGSNSNGLANIAFNPRNRFFEMLMEKFEKEPKKILDNTAIYGIDSYIHFMLTGNMFSVYAPTDQNSTSKEVENAERFKKLQEQKLKEIYPDKEYLKKYLMKSEFKSINEYTQRLNTTIDYSKEN
ncbi:hypothetical protein X285_03500 [Oenococcus oeni IOEB_9304]|uniref:P-loop NTPase fold protein n=3 Tax=Oenococcus oeni TaxID=1247 RepID=UPI0005103FBC|nr:P-loop NTPase fold protein [Oenococcus oeni]KGH78228.1 hypothetical protein X285_03500 [Oenococcus oeni IOEB_9304]KGH87348.1 hypothetical protein X292_01670 [Oenococcus oeni IOEB_C28]